LQLSAIPVPVFYTPVQPVAPIAPVKGRDPDGQQGGQTPRAAPPPGVGTLLDIQA
jgi:hypothetical protein